MYKEKFIKLFYNTFQEINWNPKVDPYSFAIGFFMGMKCDFKQADELTKEIDYDRRITDYDGD